MLLGKSPGSELQASEEKMLSANSSYSSQGIREFGMFPRQKLVSGEKAGSNKYLQAELRCRFLFTWLTKRELEQKRWGSRIRQGKIFKINLIKWGLRNTNCPRELVRLLGKEAAFCNPCVRSLLIWDYPRVYWVFDLYPMQNLGRF